MPVRVRVRERERMRARVRVRVRDAIGQTTAQLAMTTSSVYVKHKPLAIMVGVYA